MSHWIDYRTLRAQLSFTDVLRHYGVEAKIKGERATAFCSLPSHPARNDASPRTASLSIHLIRNIFQCFGCKASGNVLDFACRMEGFDPADRAQFRQGAVKVAEVFKLSMGEAKPVTTKPAAGTGTAVPARLQSAHPAQKSEPVVNAPLDFELKDLDPEHPYLRERGFSPETIRHFGLGYCNRGYMKGRIAIPLHDRAGKLVGYAGRITKDSMISEACPKYLFPGARERNGTVHEFRKSHLLYNAHRIEAPAVHLVVVEGFASTWWLWQLQYFSVVALMGSDCSEAQAAQIVDLVLPDGTVWLMPDGNGAGIDCAHRLFERVAPYRAVGWVRLPENQQPTDCSPDDLAAFFNA